MFRPREQKTNPTPDCRHHPADRWTTWAELLRQRHNRLALRHRNASFIFGKQQSGSFQQIERWHQATTRLLPLLRLSIGPVVLNFLNKGMRLFAGPGSRLEQLRTTERHFTATTPAASTTENRHELTFRETRQSTSLERSNSLYRTLHDFQSYQSQSAFLRVFTRLNENFRWLGSTRFETQLLRSNVQMVTRAINERKRLEDIRRSLAHSELLRLSRVVTHARSEEAKTFESTHTTTTTARHTVQSAVTLPGVTDRPATLTNTTHGLATLPIDIDRLTDQVVSRIDGRIIAHRERIGKVF